MQGLVEAANLRAISLLSWAEQLFGPVSSSWEYGGVIFQDQTPHLSYAPETKIVQISLSLKSLDDELQRDFQLAHEVCHLLYPTVEPCNPIKPQTTVLNEGISTYFSVMVVAADHGEDNAQMVLENLANNSQSYFRAFRHVFALMRIEQDAIKKIRAIQPLINKVLPEDIAASGLLLEEDHVKALVSLF